MGRLGWAVILGCMLGMILSGILLQRGCRADADATSKVVAPQSTIAAAPAPTPATTSSTPSWTRSGGYSTPPPQSASANRPPVNLRDRQYEEYRRMQGVGEPKPVLPQPTILDQGTRRPVTPTPNPARNRQRPMPVNLAATPAPTPSPLAANADGAPVPQQAFNPAATQSDLALFAQPSIAPRAAGGSRAASSASENASSGGTPTAPALGGLGSNSSASSPFGPGGVSVVTGLPQTTNTGGSTDTAPAAFTLSTPANGAANVSPTLQLAWNQSTNATLYRVRIATNASLGSPIFDRSNLSSLTFTIPSGTLSANTTYFWSVTASNTTSTTTRDATTVFSFTTAASTPVPTGPGAFALTSPANSARGLTGPITLAWGASSGATSYAVSVARDSAFTQVLTNTTTSQTTLSLAELTLDPGVTYFWRVEARNAVGPRLVGPFSFTPLGKPGAFSLLTPADNANPASSPVILTWSPSLDAASYRVEVATDAAFLNRVINRANLTAPTLALLPSELQTGTRYFWRVTASNSVDFTGSSPSSRSFTTPTGPGAFALLSPGVDASVGLPVTLQWDPSAGALLYRVEVSTTSTFSSTIVNQLVVPIISGTQYTVPEDLLTLGQQYFWRVTASNEAGDRAAAGGPRAFRAGVADYDVNKDGAVDVLDMYTYASLTTPTDLNGDGRADAVDRSALRNAVRARESQDIITRN